MGDRNYEGSNPGFRVAHDETSLSLVPRLKFNKNFHNWIDPQVLKKFTSEKTAKKAWRDLFGSGVKWKASSYECQELCKDLVTLFNSPLRFTSDTISVFNFIKWFSFLTKKEELCKSIIILLLRVSGPEYEVGLARQNYTQLYQIILNSSFVGQTAWSRLRGIWKVHLLSQNMDVEPIRNRQKQSHSGRLDRGH